MSSLVKATLQKINADEAETADGDAIDVQFNPESLKLKITNQVEGGRSTARQRRQQTGNSSRVLSLDLHFDTADEGTTQSPVSVREKTKLLEQFVSAERDNPDTPPKLKFQWGDLTVVGIVESLDISLEHFAANGFPLSAKVSMSLKEQDPDIQFQPGNRSSSTASKPGGKGLSGPGAGTNLSLGASLSASVGLSFEGEFGAEFAARVGVDPAAWRGLDVDLSAGANFSAGVEVGFNAGLSANAGVGLSAGVGVAKSVNAQAAQAVGASAVGHTPNSALSGALDMDENGKAMSSLGGAEATIDAIKIDQSELKARNAAASFDMDIPISSISGGSSAMASEVIRRSPLVVSGPRSLSQQLQAVSQPPPPRVDGRATSFGQGVPLQPVFPVATVEPQKVYAKRTELSVQEAGMPPMQAGSQLPYWQSLPARDDTRDAVNKLEVQKTANHCQPKSCGCGDKQ